MTQSVHEGEVVAPTPRETALIAIGQGAIMVFGGVLALLVAQIFGKTTETDAFFAAYSLYSLGVTFAQSFRLTAVASLVESPGGEAIARMFGAATVMIAVVALPMVVFAGPTGELLIPHDPTGTAPGVLRILWVALAGQLLVGMLLAALMVRGRFTLIGVASMAMGLVSVATFLATQSALGIDAAAAGLAAGSVWLAAVLALGLRRSGWRVSPRDAGHLGTFAREAGRLVYASATFVGSTLVYVVAVALAGREGAGEATLFAYAFMLSTMLLGVTGNVAALVRAPSLVAGADRVERTAATAIASVRFTAILAGPLIALALLVGTPLIELALGSGFSEDDIASILATLVLLVGWMLGSAAGLFAVVELLARRELRRLALLAVALVALVGCLAAAGAAVAGIEGIAVGLSVATVAIAALQLRLAFGRLWRSTAAQMLRDTLRQVVALALAFAPSTLLVVVAGDGAAQLVAAGLLAVGLTALATHRAWPGEAAVLTGLVRRSRPAPPVAG